MEINLDDLKERYESMDTDALLQLHVSGNLTDEAYGVLERVLETRSVIVPDRAATVPAGRTDVKQSAERECSLKWAGRLALIGLVLPLLCLILDFEPHAFGRLCELCWPTSILLMAMGTQFNLAIVLISIALNAGLWAGLGWLIGYGMSSRAKRR